METMEKEMYGGGKKQCMQCMEFYGIEYDTCPFCGTQEGAVNHDLLHMDPGTVLNGQYLVGNSIGSGGFGVTYIGWDMKLKRKVAIKEYFPSEFATRMIHQQNLILDRSEKKQKQFNDGMQKFLKEGKNLAKVGNIDGIVHMYDCFEANGTAYIVMEYLKGETLEKYLERVGTVSEEEAMDLIMPVLHALETVHEMGVIHRDIAPDNIFLAQGQDGSREVKLIDFGAAKFATTSHSKSLTVIIKPGYSPEEQYRSNGDQGTYTDTYAIAAVMYRMVTGIQPPDAFERRTMIETKKKDLLQDPGKLNPNLSANFEIAILNAMNVRIEDRTATIEDFENELISFEPVKKRGSTIRKIDFMRWPLWAKIGVPSGGAIAVALLIFALVKVFSDADRSFDMPEGMTYVPDFVTSDFDTAQDWAEEANLVIAGSGSEYAPNVTENIVLSQDVSSGSVVVENTQVNVVISSGEEEYLMPDVVGYTEEEAVYALECMGMIVETVSGSRAGLANDCVMMQDISPYEEVKTGDTVTLTVNDQESVSGVVPQLEGQQYEEALTLAADSGVSLVVTDKVFTDDYEDMQIISQSMEEGEAVSSNSVEVCVALAKRDFSMPNLLYKEQAVAEQLLANIGMTAEISEEENELVSKGLVAGQSIEKQTTVSPGQSTDLSVSKGGKPFAMPDVVGKTEEEARKTLTESGLAVSVEYGYDENCQEGSVISQSISGGADVTRGSEVTIVICSMEGLVEVSDVVGMTEDAAVEALEAQGLFVQINEVYSDRISEGKVISQLPNGGSVQKEETTIVLTISMGRDPEKVKEEEEREKEEEEEREKEEEEEEELDQEIEETEEETQVQVPYASAQWSGWSTSVPSGDVYVESKIQYRSRNKETTSSESSSMAGWTLYDTEVAYSDYGSWSDWSTSAPPSASDCVQVEQKTQYRYQDYISQQNTVYGNWSGWQDAAIASSSNLEVQTQSVLDKYLIAHYCEGTNYTSGNYQFAGSTTYHEAGWYTQAEFNSQWKSAPDGEGGYVKSGWTSENRSSYWCSNKCWRYYIMNYSYKTQYRSRSITYVDNSYWGGWSDWQDTAYSASGTRNVQNRTVYRYRTRTKTTTYYYERWTDWSAWGDSASGDEVQTQTVYRWAPKYQTK